MDENLLNIITTLVGDTSVAEQISMALQYTAAKDHTHDYADRKEVEVLKKQVEILLSLVGDTPVAEQINLALQRQGG